MHYNLVFFVFVFRTLPPNPLIDFGVHLEISLSLSNYAIILSVVRFVEAFCSMFRFHVSYVHHFFDIIFDFVCVCFVPHIGCGVFRVFVQRHAWDMMDFLTFFFHKMVMYFRWTKKLFFLQMMNNKWMINVRMCSTKTHREI